MNSHYPTSGRIQQATREQQRAIHDMVGEIRDTIRAAFSAAGRLASIARYDSDAAIDAQEAATDAIVALYWIDTNLDGLVHAHQQLLADTIDATLAAARRGEA